MKQRITSQDFLVGLLLIAVCLVVYFVIVPKQVQGEIQRGLPPDFFPKFSLIWVGLFAFFLSVKSLFARATDLPFEESAIALKEGRKGVTFAIVGTLSYLILCSLTGFIPSTLLILVILMWIFGERRRIMFVTVPLIVTVAIYLVFAKLMAVQLPQSIFFD